MMGELDLEPLWNDKYPFKKYNLHTVDYNARDPVVKDEKEIERQNREKDICLLCTKKKCIGTEECFERERKKRYGKDSDH